MGLELPSRVGKGTNIKNTATSGCVHLRQRTEQERAVKKKEKALSRKKVLEKQKGKERHRCISRQKWRQGAWRGGREKGGIEGKKEGRAGKGKREMREEITRGQ